jgi:hypothetical protein
MRQKLYFWESHAKLQFLIVNSNVSDVGYFSQSCIPMVIHKYLKQKSTFNENKVFWSGNGHTCDKSNLTFKLFGYLVLEVLTDSSTLVFEIWLFLSACFFVRFSVCLCDCLFDCLFVCLFVCLCDFLYVCFISAFLP